MRSSGGPQGHRCTHAHAFAGRLGDRHCLTGKRVRNHQPHAAPRGARADAARQFAQGRKGRSGAPMGGLAAVAAGKPCSDMLVHFLHPPTCNRMWRPAGTGALLQDHDYPPSLHAGDCLHGGRLRMSECPRGRRLCDSVLYLCRAGESRFVTSSTCATNLLQTVGQISQKPGMTGLFRHATKNRGGRGVTKGNDSEKWCAARGIPNWPESLARQGTKNMPGTFPEAATT